MLIKYLTFEISANCNMDCPFCFSNWRDEKAELDKQEIIEIIDYVKSKGLEAINFTGGEPLLKKDIAKIIKYCKQLGLTVIISTNGILLDKVIEEISEYIDFINLPLDSTDADIHNDMRPTNCVPNHQKHVIDLIYKLHSKYRNIGVKVNTLVSRKNADTIAGIGDLIKDKVVTWKLSQFIDGGYGYFHRQDFEIDAQVYMNIVKKCSELYPNLNILSLKAEKPNDYCRIISANGHLLKPDKNKLKDMGKLLNIDNTQMTNDFNLISNKKYYEKAYEQNKN